MRGSGLGLILAIAIGAGAAHALPIVILSYERTTAAEASASGTSDSDADSLPGLGPGFIESTAIAHAPAGAAASGEAQQDTTISTDGFGGAGNAQASAAGSPGFSFGSSEQLYRVVFQPTEELSLRLVGSVSTQGLPGSGVALVELSNVDPLAPPLLLQFRADAEETLFFDEVATLHAGQLYRIGALARAEADNGEGTESQNTLAAWSFQLPAAVPEPGTALLLALGLGAIARKSGRIR